MRQRNEIFIQSVFFSAAALLVVSTLALVAFIGSAGLQVFGFLSPLEFFFGTTWDQNTQTFGVLPLLYGSAITTLVTLLISAPLAIATAVFMVEIAPPRIRRVMRTV